jgi:hypothetical protein
MTVTSIINSFIKRGLDTEEIVELKCIVLYLNFMERSPDISKQRIGPAPAIIQLRYI